MEVKTSPDLILSDSEVENYYAYGFSQYGSGNWNEATDVFRILCTRRPLEARFWFALGGALQEAGKFRDALYAWAMAALLKKEDPYPHFHAAECSLSLEMRDDAAIALTEADARLPKGVPHPLQAKIGILKQQWTL